MIDSNRADRLEVELAQAREALRSLEARLNSEAGQRAASDSDLSQRISALEARDAG